MGVGPDLLAMIVVDYGYDLHRLTLPREDLDRILAGEVVSLDGPGYPVEGVIEADTWLFNASGPGSLYIATSEGRDIFLGSMDDLAVTVQVAS